MFECVGCHKSLPPTAFYKEKSKRGHTYYCRECLKKTRKIWRIEKRNEIEKCRVAYLPQHALNMRRYRQNDPEKHRKYMRKYFQLHPERRIEKSPEQNRTHNLFKSALRSGKLRRAEICEKCGSGEKIEGHHCDYSKPLEVIWLCQKCHNELNRKYA